MKNSIAAAIQVKRSARIEFMLTAIYKQMFGQDPPENIDAAEAADVQRGVNVNPDDGVTQPEATASGRALRARRTEKGKGSTPAEE